ncbi:M15 family metallopeptidase [Tessaracoccus antarcticus]|uniref:M15 family metallopeptidase n=1 Tax=Tessaracoccus antarcticus TaxID=2479848 RepID=UPI001F40D120|nr:M15 family metallopeptidase [Tessaracoccus antarcticus]
MIGTLAVGFQLMQAPNVSPVEMLSGNDSASERASGELTSPVSAFDGTQPAVANLNSPLLAALQAAATDSRDENIEILVNSGWRSAAYQNQLLEKAVSKYGSPEEAARWVATAETSAHVSGDAVDVAHFDAIGWLSEHGEKYGLCQIYANESWHFELRTDAQASGCPPLFRDPTEDPKMHP